MSKIRAEQIGTPDGVYTYEVSSLGGINNIADLATTKGSSAFVLGYSTPGDGGHGDFIWDSSDLSAEVAADTQSGIYVAPGSDLTGASGAWVRQYSGAVNVKWFGAVGGGVVDSTTAIQGALNLGGRIHIPAGDYLVSSKLTVSKQGTFIEGVAAGWGDSGVDSLTTISGSPDLIADYLLEFKTDSIYLRSVGASNIGIDVSSSDCGGLAVYGAYDASKFNQINIVGVAPEKTGLLVSCGNPELRTGSVQTVLFEDIWALKPYSRGESTAPAVIVYGSQESNYTGIKASHTSSTVSAMEIISSKTSSFSNCAFVNPLGYGVNIIANHGPCHGVTLDTCLWENCKNIIKTETTEAYLFGTSLTTVDVGSTVTQPADGSTATGTVWQSTASGIYVKDVVGNFGTGTIYKDGISLGSISEEHLVPNKRINVTNPVCYGGWTVGSAGGGEFSALEDSVIELPNDSDNSYTHDYTVDPTVYGNKFIANTISQMTGSILSNELAGIASPTFVFTGAYNTGSWPFSGRVINLGSLPKKILHFSVINLSTLVVEIYGSGYTIGPYPTSGKLLLYSGSISFFKTGNANYVIRSSSSNSIFEGVWEVDNQPRLLTKTASFAADASVVHGATVVNTGATSTINVQMSAYGAAVPLGTIFTVRRVASQAITVFPYATDTILGATAAGKYVRLDSDGAFVTLQLTAPNTYTILASYGTITFEP